MKISVGRNSKQNVVIKHSTISRNHLEVQVLTDGTLLLTDQNTTGGTYVNNRKIKSSELTENDNLKLGTYNINVLHFLKSIQTYVDKNKVDYSKEYEDLMVLFNEYQKKKNRIFKKPIWPVITRLIITLILIYLVIKLGKEWEILASYGVIGALILAGVISNFIGPTKIKMDEQNDLLRLEYESLLVCPNPKCKAKMIGQSYIYWMGKYNCINEKCGVIYKK
ncbi:MAG: FHA domain-containing protein [Saprospiraceae bacterium]